MNWCFSSNDVAFWVETEDNFDKDRDNLKITDAALTIKQFIGKTIKQLKAWMKKRGRYEVYYSITEEFWEQQALRYWIRRHTGVSDKETNALSI